MKSWDGVALVLVAASQRKARGHAEIQLPVTTGERPLRYWARGFGVLTVGNATWTRGRAASLPELIAHGPVLERMIPRECKSACMGHQIVNCGGVFVTSWNRTNCSSSRHARACGRDNKFKGQTRASTREQCHLLYWQAARERQPEALSWLIPQRDCDRQCRPPYFRGVSVS